MQGAVLVEIFNGECAFDVEVRDDKHEFFPVEHSLVCLLLVEINVAFLVTVEQREFRVSFYSRLVILIIYIENSGTVGDNIINPLPFCVSKRNRVYLRKIHQEIVIIENAVPDIKSKLSDFHAARKQHFEVFFDGKTLVVRSDFKVFVIFDLLIFFVQFSHQIRADVNIINAVKLKVVVRHVINDIRLKIRCN